LKKKIEYEKKLKELELKKKPEYKKKIEYEKKLKELELKKKEYNKKMLKNGGKKLKELE